MGAKRSRHRTHSTPVPRQGNVAYIAQCVQQMQQHVARLTPDQGPAEHQRLQQGLAALRRYYAHACAVATQRAVAAGGGSGPVPGHPFGSSRGESTAQIGSKWCFFVRVFW